MITYIPSKNETVQIISRRTGKMVYLAKVRNVNFSNNDIWRVDATIYPEKRVVAFFSNTVEFVPVEQR